MEAWPIRIHPWKTTAGTSFLRSGYVRIDSELHLNSPVKRDPPAKISKLVICPASGTLLQPHARNSKEMPRHVVQLGKKYAKGSPLNRPNRSRKGHVTQPGDKRAQKRNNYLPKTRLPSNMMHAHRCFFHKTWDTNKIVPIPSCGTTPQTFHEPFEYLELNGQPWVRTEAPVQVAIGCGRQRGNMLRRPWWIMGKKDASLFGWLSLKGGPFPKGKKWAAHVSKQ